MSKSAEKSSHYWIYKEGSEVWNRWGEGKLDEQEKARICAKIQEHCGRKNLPSATAEINFSKTVWEEPANFKDFVFRQKVNFKGAIFSKVAEKNTEKNKEDWHSFLNCQFLRQAMFEGVVFKSKTTFSRAIFKDYASFKNVTSEDGLYFKGVAFEQDINFCEAGFRGKLSFANAVFEQKLIFEKAQFAVLPDIHGTTLNGSMDFSDVNWPKRKKNAKATYDEVLQWAKLKHEMHRLHLHKEETDFFARELEARTSFENSCTGAFLVFLYRSASDYGRSVLRPLLGLLVLSIVFGAAYRYGFFVQEGGWISAAILSFQATFILIPDGRSMLAGWNPYQHIGELQLLVLLMLRGLQSLLALILIFLAGLGIRNRLRIK